MNTSGHQLTEDALGKSLACDVSQAGGPGEAVLLRPHPGDTASPGSSRGASGCEGLHSGLWGFGGSRDLIRMDSLHSALFLALPSSCPSCCLALAPAECELGVTLPPCPLLPHEAVSVPRPGACVLWARRSGIPVEPCPLLFAPRAVAATGLCHLCALCRDSMQIPLPSRHRHCWARKCLLVFPPPWRELCGVTTWASFLAHHMPALQVGRLPLQVPLPPLRGRNASLGRGVRM